MIYLDNTTQTQQVYIPRQVIQTATTREINVITSGDVINIVDGKLVDYYTSAETDTQIENAIANESGRCEQTYAKIEDIPDVSDFITSGDAQEQINQSLDGYATEQWVENQHYLTEHQSLSAYSTTEQMNTAISAATDDMATKTWVGEQGYLTEHQSLSAYSTTEQVEGMLANESARTEDTYAKKSDVPDLDNYYTSAETNTAIENAVAAESARCESTYAKIEDIPDVSDFITSGDVETQITDKNYVTSAQVETQITGKNYITSADVKTQVEEYNYVNSGQVKSQIEGYNYITASDLPDVSDFITSADAKTQIDEAIAIESARCESTYLKEHQSLAGLFDDVEYVSSAKTIVFYDKTDTEVGSIDATDFIKDGMVDNVYISANTLYIVFNTDSGKETIEIDLTQVFDANNYYTKQDIDSKHFVNSGEVKTQIEGYNYVNSGDVKTQIEDYNYITSASLPDVSDFITSADAKTQIDEAIGVESARCEQTYAKPTDIPSVDDFVTSADVETQITDKNYVTSAQVETQITGKNYITSGQVKTQIEGYNYITSGDVITIGNTYGYATSGDVKNAFVDFEVISGDSTVGSSVRFQKYNGGYRGSIFGRYINGEPIISDEVMSNLQLPTSADVQTQIVNNLSAYTKTSEFATINGSGITNGGNLVIQGGGGGGNANIIELTQAEYDALTSYTEDALYVITDAEEVDLDNYATSADIRTLSAATVSALVNKANKQNVTANSGNRMFPHWNSDGIITGAESDTVNDTYEWINGYPYQRYIKNGSGIPEFYAPLSGGTAGQVLQSNGTNNAPTWTSFKFWCGTETQYNAITTKDNDTIYFVKPD